MVPLGECVPEGGGGDGRAWSWASFYCKVYSKSLPGTMAAVPLTVSSPTPKHDPGLRREGLARGRNMPAQIARTGVLFERSKRKRRRAVGDLGQDPGEMATAGAQPALVRLGPDGCCGVKGWQKLRGRVGSCGRVEGTESFLEWRGWRGGPGEQQKGEGWPDWDTDLLL